jgi:hypothetical protein
VVDATASNTHGILLRIICVSSNQLYMPVCNKESLSPPFKTHSRRNNYFQKLAQIPQRNKVVEVAASKIDGFFFERYMDFFNSAEYTFLEQTEPIPP